MASFSHEAYYNLSCLNDMIAYDIYTLEIDILAHFFKLHFFCRFIYKFAEARGLFLFVKSK